MKKIALISSLIGILILFLIINSAEQKIVEISSVNDKMMNQKIKIIGNINELKISGNNFTILTISDKTGNIQAVCNCPNLEKNRNVEIIGKITTYQGMLQIQTERITYIN